MKKFLIALSLLCATAVHAQQYVRVWQNGESVRSVQSDITFANAGKQVTVGGKKYTTAEVDSISIVKTIFVTWSGTSASVVVPESAQKDVVVSTTGGHVTITNNNVAEEMEFVLAGTATDGSLTYNGQYKCKFHLNGLNLTSSKGAALDIQCGKRIDLVLAEGTTNSLTDAVSGEQKATLYCKGHLEIAGSGNLTLAARTRHALQSKEYLLLKNSAGTITIAQAAADALHVGQYFEMRGGTLKVDANTKGDGVQVDATDNPLDEFNGQVFIKGGTIDMTIASQDCKGIKTGSDVQGQSGGDITITGGTITIKASGNGSRGIQSDANMLIASSDAATVINITASGAPCTLPECAADPHRCMGIKVENKLTVTGGTTTVTNTGSKSRGIKVGSYSKTGGTVNATITY